MVLQHSAEMRPTSIAAPPALAIPVPLSVRGSQPKSLVGSTPATATPLKTSEIAPSSFSAYRRTEGPTKPSAPSHSSSSSNVSLDTTLNQITSQNMNGNINPTTNVLLSTNSDPLNMPAPGTAQHTRMMMPHMMQMPSNSSTSSLTNAISMLQNHIQASSNNQNMFDGNFSGDVEGGKKRKRVASKRTRVACLPCALSKSACHAERPCARCVRLNMADQCVNRVHRKMGRPRRPPVKRLLDLSILHAQKKPVSAPSLDRISHAVWSTWKSEIARCCQQHMVLPKFWTQVLQKLLSGSDQRQFMELRSRGGADHMNSGELGIVSGLLPSRYENVPAPVLSFDFHEGNVCSFTLNADALALFGRDHHELERIMGTALTSSAYHDGRLPEVFNLLGGEDWSVVFEMIREVLTGARHEFVAEVTVIPKEGAAVRCLVIVRCRRNDNAKTETVFAMFTPLPC